MDYSGPISRVVYNRVNEIVGHREIVSLRRDTKDINDIIYNLTHPCMRKRVSGGRREGFEMEGSDVDIMIWLSNTHVICDISQSQLYNSQTDVIILMEYQHSQPGFVLLRRLGSMSYQFLEESLILWQQNWYISSEMYKQSTLNSVKINLSSQPHGPCASGSLGSSEYDTAHCFECRHWPQLAMPWITRCKNQKWPNSTVLNSIVENGCHCVAIGAKQSHQEFLEWRISFALAEQKLVYSLTHEQFLCYGLLKLFLKEVLNYQLHEDEKLLCSYFMKTAVFWTIQSKLPMVWTADEFFECFWVCYKLLMKWVYHGYCPNFFIPENNMFLNKIVGSAQTRLFTQMYELYCEDYQCLLRCKSIYQQLNHVLLNLDNALNISLHTITSVSEIDRDVHIYDSLICAGSEIPVFDFSNGLHILCRLLLSDLSQVQYLHVYRKLISLLRNEYSFRHRSLHSLMNKDMYRHKRRGLNILNDISNRGCVSDILYLSLYLYSLGRYTQALRVLQESKSRLTRPYLMHPKANLHAYNQAMCSKPLLTRYRQSWMSHIIISDNIHNLEEFKVEFEVLSKHNRSSFTLSPNVLLHFLSLLCYHRLHDTAGQLRSLQDLQTLVLHNDINCIFNHLSDTAWHVLGMSQKLCGYYDDALYSFYTSLSRVQYNMITEATIQRIISLQNYSYIRT